MKKMIAIYTMPDDPEKFMQYYRENHLPLVSKVPGLIKSEITSVERCLSGSKDLFLLAEMYFSDEDSLKAALKSPENLATGADLANFAEGLVTVVTGSVVEA